MITALIIRLVSLRPNLPPLQAVQLPNGEVGVTLRSLCAFLSINLFSQLQRIARSQSLRGALITVTVDTKGGPQEATVLLAWAVPLWVTGIQPSRLNPAKRDAVLILQQEAVPVLYRAFWHAVAPQMEPPSAAIPAIAAPDPLEARVAALETTVRDEAAKREMLETTLRDEVAQRAIIETILRDELAKRETLETTLRDEIAQRTALARQLARSEALLAAAIQRLLSHGHHPTEPPPGGPPPRRGPGRPRRRR